jgi:hypothetical protein
MTNSIMRDRRWLPLAVYFTHNNGERDPRLDWPAKRAAWELTNL